MSTKELEAEIAALREELKALRTEISMLRFSQPHTYYLHYYHGPAAQPYFPGGPYPNTCVAGEALPFVGGFGFAPTTS